MAIEQLTGAVTPKPVVIAAAAAPSSGASSKAIIRLDDALGDLEKAQVDRSNAEKALHDLNGETKTCDQLDIELSAAKVLPADKMQRKSECDSARANLQSARQKLVEKNAHYEDFLRLAERGNFSAVTAVRNTGTGGLDQAERDSIHTVAKFIDTLVERNFDNETETLNDRYLNQFGCRN